MKVYGDSAENLRRFLILEMDGQNGQLHFSVLEEEEFSQLPVVVGRCRNSSRCGSKQRIS
jgi:hypothetical protein